MGLLRTLFGHCVGGGEHHGGKGRRQSGRQRPRSGPVHEEPYKAEDLIRLQNKMKCLRRALEDDLDPKARAKSYVMQRKDRTLWRAWLTNRQGEDRMTILQLDIQLDFVERKRRKLGKALKKLRELLGFIRGRIVSPAEAEGMVEYVRDYAYPFQAALKRNPPPLVLPPPNHTKEHKHPDHKPLDESKVPKPDAREKGRGRAVLMLSATNTIFQLDGEYNFDEQDFGSTIDFWRSLALKDGQKPIPERDHVRPKALKTMWENSQSLEEDAAMEEEARTLLAAVYAAKVKAKMEEGKVEERKTGIE